MIRYVTILRYSCPRCDSRWRASFEDGVDRGEWPNCPACGHRVNVAADGLLAVHLAPPK